ncbi:hypothetical protein BASA81_001286 [Batrachochytrium salamandrivorans]|nr:hypothetical protein BASA81_001286 [Batrachochytrium salamandrivorans]
MEDERDLSPITILLLGCVVAALVFKAIERAYSSAIQHGLKAKFKRKTREEEEEALLRARAEVENAEEEGGEEGGEEEEGELMATDFGTATGSLSRRDLAKIQKKRERQERREQFQALLQHEKDLRVLREKEDLEREEFERQREAERAKLVAKSAPKVMVAPAPPSDQEVAGFFQAEKETLLTKFDSKYPFLAPQVRAGMIDRLIIRGGFVRVPKRGAVYRIDEEDLARVRQLVISTGSALHADLAELLAG